MQDRRNFAAAGYKGAAHYCPEKSCRIAAALARLGNATDVDFVLALDTSVPEFHSWKRQDPEFAEAVKATPTASDAGVERAMLKYALGFSYETGKVITTREGPAVRRVTVPVPPSVDALEFLLRARMPRLYGAQPANGSDDCFLEFLNKRKPSAPAGASNEPPDHGAELRM